MEVFRIQGWLSSSSASRFVQPSIAESVDVSIYTVSTHLPTHLPTYLPTYIHTYTHACCIHTCCTDTNTHAHMHTLIYIYIHTHVGVYNMNIHIQTYTTPTCNHASIHACMRIYMHLYTYIHTSKPTHIHTYIHTYMHTYDIPTYNISVYMCVYTYAVDRDRERGEKFAAKQTNNAACFCNGSPADGKSDLQLRNDSLG